MPVNYTLIFGAAIVAIIIAAFYFVRNYNVVSPAEIHIISSRGGTRVYDGRGSYVFFPIFQRKTIISKAVMEIAVPKIRLHDKDHLPFAVEISCKVQVSDGNKAAEALGNATPNEIRPIVDDTIQSAARSQAMQQDLPTIMRDRDTIEEAIYRTTTDSLARLGVKVALFDIKNIVDVDNSTVIADMERVRSAELNRMAREAEAEQSSRAEIVEAQKKSEAEIRRQEAFKDSEEARYKQEQYIAEQRRELTLKEMEVLSIDTRRKAEIEGERIEISAEAEAERYRREARGKADSRLIEAEAEAESTKLKAEADAEVIRKRLEAEAEGTTLLAEALQGFNEDGISVKLAEINAEAQKKMSENIAKGIQSNSKLFLPIGNGNGGLGSTLTSLIPTIDAMKESDINLADLIKKTENKDGNNE